MNTYFDIVAKKGLTRYDYQEKFLTNPEFQNPDKPIVMAFGTGGGKTFTTIMMLDIFYSNPENKGKKTVVFPHATNVLRTNFGDSLEEYGDRSFSYCIIENQNNAKDTGDLITEKFESDCEVIVVLPQTIRKHLTKLSKAEWMIVDEAHEWYTAPTYEKIRAALHPEKILLLTGTPSIFNNKPEKFLYYHVSVDELRKVGKAGNARIEIVSSNYEITGQDISSRTGNVDSKVTNRAKNADSLKKVCNQMLKTLNNPTSFRMQTPNNLFGTLFNQLEKTIIFCNSQPQAKQFYKSLDKYLPGQVLISVSDDGGNSEEFAQFKTNNNVLVLLLVRKGRLGFDMSELYNIVDFTLSTNVDVIMQMLGRILRPGKKNILKRYFKVSPQNTVWFFESIMMVVLRLTMQDAYEIYDGNQNDVRIPKSRKARRKYVKSEGPRKERQLNFSAIDTDLILDLDFFRQVLHKGHRDFQTVSWCTLNDVRTKCLNLRIRRTNERGWTYEEVLELAKKYNRKIEFQTMQPAAYTYASNQQFLDKIVAEAGLTGRKLILTYEECKEAASQCNTRTEMARRFQPKYKKSKDMGWLDEFFGDPNKTGKKRRDDDDNFELKKGA